MLNRDEDILQAAEDWQKAGHGVALATVVETWGSAPRPAGSSLVIVGAGQISQALAPLARADRKSAEEGKRV
mgnify:CR=1 FL=1